jgi:hypothetical protein
MERRRGNLRTERGGIDKIVLEKREERQEKREVAKRGP